MITWTIIVIMYTPSQWNPSTDVITSKTLIEGINTQEACEAIAVKIGRHSGIRTEVVCVPRHG